MSSRRNSLSPPSPSKAEKEDPGAHELEASDSEDHFSDAQSGPALSHPASPIPRTRVERVDDKPAYGEVPGTKAYSMREEDAMPDEIAFVPDPDSKPTSESEELPPRAPTPGGHPIPKTVVEETSDSPTAVTRPETEEKQKHHRADPPPDIIVKADGQKVENGGDGEAADTPMSATSLKTPGSARLRRKSSTGAFRRSPLSPSFPSNISAAGGDGGGDDDDFGDDFDDFEEGDEDADFDDFGDDFQQSEQIEPTPATALAAPPPPPPPPPPQPQQPALSFPIPSFDDVDASEIFSITGPYLSALFPSDDDLPDPLPFPAPSRDTNPIFLTPRSASLWSQLVAPPPLQPPDWIRSRIRRLFLVSLGVPVDLDEILPASKQKKLVLPSLLHKVSSTGSLRNSDGGGGGNSSGTPRSLSRVRASGNNASSTSVDSQGNLRPSKSKRDKSAATTATKDSEGSSSSSAAAAAGNRKGPPPEPNLDLTSAKQLCMTTDEALRGMTDQELGEHVARLEAMQGTAHEMLVYWQKRTDEKIGDREAFEGVIENLVKHARKTRK